jgi:hypothetical protein
MIEMNLVSSPAYIVGNYSSSTAKKSAGIFVFIVILALIPAAAVFLVKTYFILAHEKIEIAVQETQVIAAKSRTPSERIIEEIIDSVSPVREIPLAEKKYEEMQKLEQFDYEVKFNHLALSEFLKILPKELPFNAIKVSNYRNIIIEGTTANRDVISQFLARLRAGNEWELLSKPRTSISQNGANYNFRVEAMYFPSASTLIKNPINPDKIPDVNHLNDVKNRIEAAAKKAELKTVGLLLLDSKNEPDEKIYRYSIKLDGDFTNVLHFLRTVSQMNEPIRNENIVIKNKQKSVDATVILVINVR